LLNIQLNNDDGILANRTRVSNTSHVSNVSRVNTTAGVVEIFVVYTWHR